jgi:hypothetical protein
MTNLNGRDVSVTALAKAIASLYRTYKGRHFPVFVIVDRETREISAEALEDAIVEALRSHGIPQDQVIVGCPDRMIENWMLADRDYMAKVFGCVVDHSTDGVHGKVTIRHLLRSGGRPYHEITVGVEIFKRVCPFRVAAQSPSFARFSKRANTYCPWLRRKRKLPA